MKYLYTILLTITCIAVYLFAEHPAQSYGYSSIQSDVGYHVIFMFAHVSLLHLMLNLFALWSLIPLYKAFSLYKMMLIPLSASIAASYFAVMMLPTVGLSGLLYAMIGMLCYNMARNGLHRQLFNIIIITTTISIIQSKDHVNVMLHIFSFLFAWIICYMTDEVDNKQ